MAGVRLSLLKSLYRSINSSCKPHSAQVRRLAEEYTDLQPAKSFCVFSAFQKKEPYTSFNLLKSRVRAIGFGYPLLDGVSNLRMHSAKPFNYSIPLLLSHSSYARPFSSTPGATGTGDGNDIDWVDKAKHVLQTSVDAVTETARKTKDASDEMIPHVQQLLDSNPYLKEVIFPISLTMTGTLFAWVVMPRILRRFHKYAMQGSAALLPGGFSNEHVPYEKSFWGALEDPARYLVTFIAFAQMLFPLTFCI